MAQHWRKITMQVPWRRLLIHRQNATPIRNFWGFNRPSEFRSLIRDMDRSIERLERELIDKFPFRGLLPRMTMIPIQGVESRSDTFHMNIDVDGYKPEEIKLSLKNNILTIHAKMDRIADDGSKYHQEYTRELTLPENVDLSELKTYLGNNGILRLEAAYKPTLEEKPKEIPVSRD
ncbi:hypothetical protein L9F63_021485 [Diploptera punctata]|uniref:SHSP domain-containing protein n=1 Tax=Diploptera punctata TaxID=6984 RepID=A0AAD8EBG9_DIPPU|nr:hypothetical protein L9F63_021485 [Diploptera punctata]